MKDKRAISPGVWDDLAPSTSSALVIPVTLPPGLEAIRLAHVTNAVDGVPAHVTLLFPFAEPRSIDAGVITMVRDVVAGHQAWTMALTGPAAFPDALYAAVEPPDAPIALQSDLAAAFPSLPIYRGSIDVYVPHVTIAELGRGSDTSDLEAASGWRDLPSISPAREVELIVCDPGGRWSVKHRFPLRASPASS
jgi:2'-5' RNA ligase